MKTLVAISVVVLVVLGAGYYLLRFHRASANARPVPQAETAGNPVPAPSSAAGGAPLQKIRTPKFDALAAPVPPGFLHGVVTTPDVKIAFYYEGDERTPTDENFYVEKTSIANEQNEKYLLLPSLIDPNKGYGPTEFEIFKNQESHAYQGIPVSILNANARYSLQYVGLKINDPRLISHLSVEVGIDYRADDDGDVLEAPPASQASLLPLWAWFSPPPVYACGPGLYLRPIGHSSLSAAQIENGVAWYKLEKPIALYNLPLDYCDKPPAGTGSGKKPSAKKEDEEADDDLDAYCAPIKDLTSGHLRLHILYQPNGVPGVLQMQAVNFILQDEQGRYFQPTGSTNFNTYYKAYLVDRGCLNSGKQPAECVSQ